MVRMFPSPDREKIVSAHQCLVRRWKPQLDLQRGAKELYISVGKTSDKTMDCVGVRGHQLWNAYSINEYLQVAFANLFLNDFFTMGDTLMRQAEGTAIGGPMSAQDADICLLADESEVPWGTTVPLTLRLARFRDNIMFLCPLKYCQFWAHHLKKFLTDLYSIDLDFEQLGRGLTFLETEVWCVGNHVHWGLKNKVLNGMLTPNPQIERYPSPHDPMAPQLVSGLATACGKKAVAIATRPDIIESNISHIVWEMRCMQYPTRWWHAQLYRQYQQAKGVRKWQELLRTLPWYVPVPAKHCLLCPTTCQPQISLNGPQVEGRVQRAWEGLQLLTLKEAIQMPIPHAPPDVRKPSDTARTQTRTKQRTTTTRKTRPTEPIARRTRNQKNTTTAPNPPHTTATKPHQKTARKAKHTGSKHTTTTRVTRRSRQRYTVSAGNTQIDISGQMYISYLDHLESMGCTEHPT